MFDLDYSEFIFSKTLWNNMWNFDYSKRYRIAMKNSIFIYRKEKMRIH